MFVCAGQCVLSLGALRVCVRCCRCALLIVCLSVVVVLCVCVFLCVVVDSRFVFVPVSVCCCSVLFVFVSCCCCSVVVFVQC